MSRHVVIVASRATGRIFEVFGSYATEEKARAAASALYEAGRKANDYYGQDYRVDARPLKPAWRGAAMTRRTPPGHRRDAGRWGMSDNARTAEDIATRAFWDAHQDKSGYEHHEQIQRLPGGALITCTACDWSIEVQIEGGSS